MNSIEEKNEIKENDKNKENIKKIGEQESNKKKKLTKNKSKNKFKSKEKLINPQNNNENIIIINESNESKEIIQLKEEIRKNEKKLKRTNPQHFELINNLTKSEINYRVDNTFEIFNSICGYICLVYAYKLEDKYNSIATYDITDCKTLCVMKNAHKEDITNFRHYLDKANNRDLILSISAANNNVKMWDINNLEYLLTINNINMHGFTKSACILNFNNDLFVVTSNYSYSEVPEPIKLYNLEGYKIKEINYKNNQTYFIDIYHDKKSDIKYIITGNLGFVRTYDYSNDCKYHRYNDYDGEYEHYKVIIFEKEDIIKIIATGKNGEVLIWDFHSTELLKIIKVNEIDYDNLYGICLWNRELLFVGCGNSLKVVDLEKEKVVNTLIGHSHNVITIKTVFHPQYGECIVSQELYTGQMKLWMNKAYKLKRIIEELNEKLWLNTLPINN